MATQALNLEDRFWSKVDRRGPDECWLWNSTLGSDGYGKMRAGGAVLRAHRLSAQLAGMRIDGLSVRHTCDPPRCVNPAHLQPGTHQENMRDMKVRGRSMLGERNPQARLREAQVVLIRQSPLSTRKLAAQLGVSQTAVQEARIGKKWGWVK